MKENKFHGDYMLVDDKSHRYKRKRVVIVFYSLGGIILIIVILYFLK